MHTSNATTCLIRYLLLAINMTTHRHPSPSSQSTIPEAALISPEAKYPPQILLFGDSITEGATAFTSKLTNLYSRRADVLNRGFSGYTTTLALRVLPQFFPPDSPSHLPRVRLMTVFFGANDACVPGEAQHVPIDLFKENLKRIVTWEGVKSHETRVMLVTPGPVDEWQLDGDARNVETTNEYADVVKRVAAEEGVSCVDMWGVMMGLAGWRQGQEEALQGSKKRERSEVLDELLGDGLHFTEKGYDVLYSEVVGCIGRDMPEMKAEEMDYVFPDWKDLLGVRQ